MLLAEIVVVGNPVNHPPPSTRHPHVLESSLLSHGQASVLLVIHYRLNSAVQVFDTCPRQTHLRPHILSIKLKMETVYSQDIKDAANLMADDLVVACVFETISFFSLRKGLLLTIFYYYFFQIYGTDRSRKEQCE